jgi:hypothetical protein
MLAFKLDETRYGQLTFMRIYQGTVRKGDMVTNMSTEKRLKIPRIVRLHSDEMEDIDHSINEPIELVPRQYPEIQFNFLLEDTVVPESKRSINFNSNSCLGRHLFLF